MRMFHVSIDYISAIIMLDCPLYPRYDFEHTPSHIINFLVTSIARTGLLQKAIHSNWTEYEVLQPTIIPLGKINETVLLDNMVSE